MPRKPATCRFCGEPDAVIDGKCAKCGTVFPSDSVQDDGAFSPLRRAFALKVFARFARVPFPLADRGTNNAPVGFAAIERLPGLSIQHGHARHLKHMQDDFIDPPATQDDLPELGRLFCVVAIVVSAPFIIVGLACLAVASFGWQVWLW